MNVILLGAPGAGKGTIATLMKERFNIPHVSTGDMLREEMKSESEIGLELKKYVESGELVPDAVIIKMIENSFSQDSSLSNGYILDGFPRTISQAEDLDKILNKLDHPVAYVLYFDVHIDVIIRRLTGRRICRKCGAIYHLTNMPPKTIDVCDLCDGELYQRPDDNEETIKTRMDVYVKNTEPIIEYYDKQSKLVRLDGNKESKDLLEIFVKMTDEDKKTNQD